MSFLLESLSALRVLFKLNLFPAVTHGMTRDCLPYLCISSTLIDSWEIAGAQKAHIGRMDGASDGASDGAMHCCVAVSMGTGRFSLYS